MTKGRNLAIDIDTPDGAYGRAAKYLNFLGCREMYAAAKSRSMGTAYANFLSEEDEYLAMSYGANFARRCGGEVRSEECFPCQPNIKPRKPQG